MSIGDLLGSLRIYNRISRNAGEIEKNDYDQNITVFWTNAKFQRAAFISLGDILGLMRKIK